MAVDALGNNTHVLYTETETTIKDTGTETGMGQDAFMKMFLAQMTNQNPLDPMDNTDFTAQLAQFSSLEKLTLIADSLAGFGRLEEAYAKTQALSYLGREVTVSGGTMPLIGGYSNSVLFNVDSPAYVYMRITDPNGQVVANRDLGLKAQDITHEVTWDGLSDDGKLLADGAYKVSLYAYDANGSSISVKNQQVTGIVTGYESANGKDYLLLGDAAVEISKVINVRLARVVDVGYSQEDAASGTSDDSGDEI
ncbi:MAG: flagellar hook assembly protein FlgD [Desulfarculales bacterium]|jgi:flagellar basal-body rod modification protein FlgD|nr:flagellar hook assembly protein FlgD [Desulfarculales bacterium]